MIFGVGSHCDRYVAIMLVELAVAEPGENWEGETFNGISGWELPMSWTKEVPLCVVTPACSCCMHLLWAWLLTTTKCWFGAVISLNVD